jgi:hypothetical protein
VILLLFFSLKKSDFKTICFKKITKHGKKKSDKDEIGNIVLKHVFTGV